MKGLICVGGPLAIRAFAVGLFLLGCGDADVAGRACAVDIDCVSGKCLGNGQCAPVGADVVIPGDDGIDADGLPAGEDGTGSGDGGAGPEDGKTPSDGGEVTGEEDGGGGPGCLPNGDGKITEAELPFGPDLKAMFRSSENVDPYQSACSEPCSWDFTGVDGETNEDVEMVTLPPTGWWFSTDFPDATHVAEMADFSLDLVFMEGCKQKQVGIYKAGPEGLLLLGIASEKEEPLSMMPPNGPTLLAYDPPVPLLSYPLEAGKAWKTETVLSGKLCGSLVDYNIDQTWDSEVDAVGAVKTPYGDFPNVMRVSTLAVRHAQMVPPVSSSTVRTHTFVTECFTTIATAVSQEGVDTQEFDAAMQVRALTAYPHD